MSTLHPWKHSIADVYSNNYGSVVQDYLSLVVEPSLDNLRRRRDELMANPDTDPAVKAFQVFDHVVLKGKASMAFCLAIQSLWEQQIRTYMSSCVQQLSIPGVMVEKVETVLWGDKFNAIFLKVRGLELPSFSSFKQLDLLMLLGNVCRHGEGPAAQKLWDKRPDLWHSHERYDAPLPAADSINVVYRPSTNSLILSLDLLRSLVEAVVLFWRDMERYGLKTFMPSEMSDASIEELLSNRVRAG
jgi:hypothetical protein